MPGWFIFAIALAYLLFLFLVASYGDRRAAIYGPGRAQPFIYALSLAVYCTSWTFFGSVGLAAERGYEFLAIYVGPILVFTLGNRFLRRMVRIAKAEKLTSIADFLASRYGKNIPIAALATMIATIGVVPYIALQLKAISGAVDLMGAHYSAGGGTFGQHFMIDLSLIITIVLAVFAALFGTRHADATEHQEGMMLAISVESLIKLVAFLILGFFVTFLLLGTPAELLAQVRDNAAVQEALAYQTSIPTWIALTVMSGIAVIALPRQYHVGVVECHNERDIKTAAWLFPLYLIAINIFVLPIAFAGNVALGEGTNADLYILALPLSYDQELLALVAFIGGLSAATAMVIVASVALSIMITNDLIMPVVIRRTSGELYDYTADRSRLILMTRRLAIVVILLFAFAYYRAARHEIPLASIGLVSFAAIAQFAPALIGGMMWRRANARGAFAGMIGGFTVWLAMLLLPTVAAVPAADFNHYFPLNLLPTPSADSFLGGDLIAHGLFWSLLVNTALYVAGSLSRQPLPLERVQASLFVPHDVSPYPTLKRFRTTVTVDDLREAVARYLGHERTQRSFDLYQEQEGRVVNGSDQASSAIVRYAEQLLASAVGSSSARLILSLLFQSRDRQSRDAFKLLDDASDALQQNRDLLQTALDQMEQGITVLDANYRLTCWNSQFRRLFGLPDQFGRVGVSVGEVLHYLAEAGEIPSEIGTNTINRLSQFGKPWITELQRSGRIIEIRTNPMPDGGIVATYTDITAIVKADKELKQANESLENRVADRTAELVRVNRALSQAQRQAEDANLGKTRFLAASGHDILQPLNAARLYAESLKERAQGDAERTIAANIDSSLESVESILGAVLEISRLDTGALKPSKTKFAANDVLHQVYTDMAPLADKKGLALRFVESSIWLDTDRNLFRRLVQNLVSNAIKYTREGGLVFGFRRRGSLVALMVADTGIGIPADKLEAVFKEFTRLAEGSREAAGHGLGLSIVDRIARVLHIDLAIRSNEGRGTVVTATLPETAAAAAPAPTEEIGVIVGRQANLDTSGLSVLCIDNDHQILAGMRLLLKEWGCLVSTASGIDGVGLEEMAEPPDIILADYHLDDGNGIDAILAIRSHFDEAVPACLLTADRTSEVKTRAQTSGILVINKPVKPAYLRAALAQARRAAVAAE